MLHAYVAPHDRLEFDVAPLPHTFETFPASERIYSLMNHELIHEVQGDIANARRNGVGGDSFSARSPSNPGIPNHCSTTI